MKVYLYRHGETTYNSVGIIQGRGVDAPLNEAGKAQAAAFFEAYKNIPFDRLFMSTLQRTHQTVAPFEALGIPMQQRTELDEISWGDWEGKTASQKMGNAHLNLLNDWGQGQYARRVANGESALEMQKRLQPFVEELQDLEQQHILICAHGGTLGFLLPMLLEEPLSKMPTYKHHNTGLDILEYKDGQYHLLLQNDFTHLS